MPAVVHRRVISPVLAVKGRGFETIPIGSIIETSDDLREPGLNSIRFGTEELFAFTRDIEERSQQIDQPQEMVRSLVGDIES